MSQKSSAGSSLKSSNASLSSNETRCIIMLSSFEENAPPVVIFPENYYHDDEDDDAQDIKAIYNSRKLGMKKQVSFDDSITENVESKYAQLHYEDGKMYHSIVSGSIHSDSESLTLTTNMSTVSVEKAPDYRIIIFMWSFSTLYALFDDQMMRPAKKCSVSTELFTQLGVPSIFMALILPLACGPILCGTIRRILVALEQVKLLIRRTPSQISIPPPSDASFPFFLTLIHAFTYTSNMILAELFYPTYIDIFSYMLLKYCIGFSFSILYPIAALCTQEDLRREVVRVYKENHGAKVMTKEEKEQEIGKEMLKHLQ